MTIRDKIRQLLSGLSKNERDHLLAELLADNVAYSVKAGVSLQLELQRVENYLLETVEKSAQPKIRNSRLRLWFIFMLLRYGGLRLEEIFGLKAEELDFHNCQLLIHASSCPRKVPLPHVVVVKMHANIEKWTAFFALTHPFQCDGSFVRRSFSQLAETTHIPSQLFNARSLRRNREQELKNAGIPQNYINFFLGRAISDQNFNVELAQDALKKIIEKENFPRTSARNAFSGHIRSLERKGILVEIVLETLTGFEVFAIITDTSRRNLGLKPSMPVTALVKAPLVNIFKLENENAPMPANHFIGQISDIKHQDDVWEIMVSLPHGPIICALYGKDKKAPFTPSLNLPVGVEFSPYSVILIRD